MAEGDCCDSFGGRISITVDGDRMTPSDADITLDPSNIEVEGKANQDGSACYTSKPKLYGAEIKFRNGCGIKWDERLRRCKIDVTISEEDNSRTHIFTGARFTGKPTVNLSTGEVEGVKIEGPQYQALNS
ncbi:phage tail tube protein [Rhodopseudomonas sp. B29]|uniref:phage tail tube protein n=1 Tax=Rhodopseudomonas sp. B29 TaxID=95607 RepID=UPI000345C78C|nr:phage tail tube protein [Rhodopseudomonas sp. B29]